MERRKVVFKCNEAEAVVKPKKLYPIPVVKITGQVRFTLTVNLVTTFMRFLVPDLITIGFIYST